jgi:uncharacterized protein (TIGR00251 family)
MKKTVTGKKGHLTIKIKVEPRSSKSGITGPYRDALKVKLTSPPIEGRANKELIEVLAEELGIAKKDIEIISGQSSKNKIVRIHGMTAMPEKLKCLID